MLGWFRLVTLNSSYWIGRVAVGFSVSWGDAIRASMATVADGPQHLINLPGTHRSLIQDTPFRFEKLYNPKNTLPTIDYPVLFWS